MTHKAQLDLAGSDGSRPGEMRANSSEHMFGTFPDGAVSDGASRASASPDEAFVDQFEFFDDVHGSIHLSRVERDLVDTPEFQRLFRLGQLGFVDLVFPTANHTRAVHCIGASHLAKRLVDNLNQNNKRLPIPVPEIARSERALIGIGALLHDLPHGPFSHDIEKKKHLIEAPPDNLARTDHAEQARKKISVISHYGLYPKHDDFASNPALYVAILDPAKSVLARVLKDYSGEFWRLLQIDAQNHRHLEDFVKIAVEKWPARETEVLPALVFHLLVYEKAEEAEHSSRPVATSFTPGKTDFWGLGPGAAQTALHNAWYQPFRHDIIGNTLSADLIDYLQRDQARLGMKNELDLKLLNNYILVPVTLRNIDRPYRCAIDLIDQKRGTFRAERLNDIFRMLDFRHQIHEKAVCHRVVQAAVAMLSRAGLILDSKKPKLEELYEYGGETPAIAGDEHFLDLLIKRTDEKVKKGNAGLAEAAENHKSLPLKIAERRVFRPLMVISGDKVPTLLGLESSSALESTLRELAAIVDSKFFSRFFLLVSRAIEVYLQHAVDSEEAVNKLLLNTLADTPNLLAACEPSKRVIFWTTPYKQLYKDPALLVCANDQVVETIDELRRDMRVNYDLRRRIEAGIQDAETKNEGLWKIYVFISDALFYTGALAKILRDPCATETDEHLRHLQTAQEIAVRSIRSAWQYWTETGRSKRLNDVMDLSELARIVRLFVDNTGLEKLRENRARDVSAVRVDLYVHGPHSNKCRDVRYRFGSERKWKQVLSDLIKDKELKEEIAGVLIAVDRSEDPLMDEEAAEVITHLARAREQIPAIIDRVAAARNSGFNRDALRHAWLPRGFA